MNNEDERVEQSSLAVDIRTGLPQADAPQFGSVEAKHDLRRQAEKLFRETMACSPEDLKALSLEEGQLLLHELQVHQIELEIQNKELWRAQVELDAARERYFELYDLAPVGYVVVNNLGLILDANFTAATLLGCSPGSLANQPFSRFILKEDQDGYYLLRKQLVLFESNSQTCELRMVKRDETVIWVQLSTTLVQDKDDAPLSRIVLIDITERKQAEEAMRESEQNFKTLANSGQALIWTSGTDKRCNYFNRVWLEFTGRTFEQERGDGWLEGVHADDIQRCLDIYVGAFDRREKFSRTYRLRRSDGEYCWLLDDGCPRYDSNGAFTGYIGHCLDITRRKRAEDEIRRNESRLKKLVDILQHPSETVQDFLDYALEQSIQLTGSKIGYIYHYLEDRKELVLNSWSKDVLPACAVANPQSCYELEKTGIWGEAVRQRRALIVNDFQTANPLKKGYPDGHVQLLKFVTIPIFKGGRIVSVVGLANKETDYDETDILQISLLMDSVWKVTDSMQSEMDKIKLETQFQQAQKMEAVGRLAGGVAHDFNNMLGVIIGYAELALEQVDPSSLVHQELQEIYNAGKRSANITRQLLAFARKQNVAPEVIDLNETVDGMLKMLRRLVGEDINLTWTPETGLWSVKIDPSQVDQIIANLCVNARDAITGVGKIIVETKNCSFDAEYCDAHPGLAPGDYVQLSVSDTGCGMDKLTVGQIFEPFFTTKGVGEGTGLGLASVYGAVKQNKGFINVHSEPGQGTTFTICLPRFVSHSGQLRVENSNVPTARGHENVLLVEDELSILKMTTIMLQQQGYTVLAASTPGAALRLASDFADKIHLLLTDVIMPEMNGRELVDRLLPSHPEMKYLFMSGYTADIIATHGVLDEGVDFIQKPFTLTALSAKIRKALE